MEVLVHHLLLRPEQEDPWLISSSPLIIGSLLRQVSRRGIPSGASARGSVRTAPPSRKRFAPPSDETGSYPFKLEPRISTDQKIQDFIQRLCPLKKHFQPETPDRKSWRKQMYSKVRISCQSGNCFTRKFDLDFQKEQGNTSSGFGLILRTLLYLFIISCIRL